jgi:hypothetical protein
MWCGSLFAWQQKQAGWCQPSPLVNLAVALPGLLLCHQSHLSILNHFNLHQEQAMATNLPPELPKDCFTIPTQIDIAINLFWETLKENDSFILQRIKARKNALFRGMMGTIQNV